MRKRSTLSRAEKRRRIVRTKISDPAKRRAVVREAAGGLRIRVQLDGKNPR